jgi:hypothetical protein
MSLTSMLSYVPLCIVKTHVKHYKFETRYQGI